jgi:hypothetical protein
MFLSKEANKRLINYIYGFSGMIDLYNKLVRWFGNGAKVETVLYDKASNGNITTSANMDSGLILPAGAIVKDIVIDTLANVDSASDTATLSIFVADADTEDGAGAICSDLTQANLQKGSYKPSVTSVKIKTNTALLFKAGTEAITAGKFRVIIEYYLTID